MSSHPTHVLPRPVEALPDYAYANARQSLVEKLIAAFSLSEAAAQSVADAVVNPSAVRKGIGEPTEPRYETIRIPCGELKALRTEVWSRYVMPDPRNPRIGPSLRHPFAVEPGTGNEDSRFRPVPDPTLPVNRPDASELEVRIESRDHLAWACAQAKKYVLAENNWRDSIAAQGVMEPVWLAVTTYVQSDGQASVTVPTTIEGSSRTTAVHDLLGVVSADLPYERSDAKHRADLRRLNETLDDGMDADQQIALRCETMPALLIVGFEPHGQLKTEFPSAIKSLVALRHVDPPKPWGDGPENEALADEVLEEMRRRGLISQNERDYLAGSSTREQARAANLPDDPVLRATRIVRLMTSDDESIKAAIRVAVTSQSTRKRITTQLINDLTAALILRAIDADPKRRDQIRRNMRRAFGKSVLRNPWEATSRDLESLFAEAHSEAIRALASEKLDDPGPASLELAVRASYPLLVKNRLTTSKRFAGYGQSDGRNPSEILDVMRRRPAGIHQLAQVLRDFKENRAIRLVDAEGNILTTDEGQERTVTDELLRETYPPKGKMPAKRSGNTPAEVFGEQQGRFANLIEALQDGHRELSAVVGSDGTPMCEAEGIDPEHVKEWRNVLQAIDDDLNIWGRRYRQKFTQTESSVHHEDDGEVGDEADDLVDDAYSEPFDEEDSSFDKSPSEPMQKV